jgi:O-methyltransferase
MDVPEHGPVEGLCNMRASLPSRVEHVGIVGKRVLEIGPASGFFTFAMERAGADVCCVELARTDSWDVVPHSHPDANITARFVTELDRVRNSFWFCHERFGSKARVYESPVYDIPASLGPFDVVCIHDVLTHLRDPRRALATIAPFATETLIVSEVEPYGGSPRGTPLRWLSRHLPLMFFCPRDADTGNIHTWEQIGAKAAMQMVGILGFAPTIEFYSIAIGGRPVCCYTIVGRRHKP